MVIGEDRAGVGVEWVAGCCDDSRGLGGKAGGVGDDCVDIVRRASESKDLDFLNCLSGLPTARLLLLLLLVLLLLLLLAVTTEVLTVTLRLFILSVVLLRSTDCECVGACSCFVGDSKKKDFDLNCSVCFGDCCGVRGGGCSLCGSIGCSSVFSLGCSL